MLTIKRDSFADILFRSYSYILFSNSVELGFVILLLSFINPSAAIHSLISFGAAFLFGELIGHNRKSMLNGLYLYNPILVGFALGYLYEISFVSVGFAAVAGVLTFGISASFHTALYTLFKLPILNLPFAISATAIYLARIHYRSLEVYHTASFQWLNIESFPEIFSGLFRAIGILIFLPYDYVGIVLLLIFLLYSRINFFLIVAGYYTGVLFHSLLTMSLAESLANPYSFNYILIAVALGGYFCIPAKRSYLIALLGVLISSVILEAGTVLFSLYQIPVFTIPFAVTVMLLLHLLKMSGFPYVTQVFLTTPEETLEHWQSYKTRFHDTLPAPKLPFSGEWSIYQGFDDDWTHQGVWKHAVDFVIEDFYSGLTYKNSGEHLEDYLCYKKPVLSPITGTVVAFENSIVDNPIGVVDKENNWGNYIIIWSDFGYYVELSHFQKGSIDSKVGDRVLVGQKIGLCGNSGYSPQPHIHMQVQKFNYVGSPTLPFTFSDSVGNNRYVKKLIAPEKGDRFSSLILSRRVQHKLLFILDEEYQYEISIDGRFVETLSLIVKMDISGAYYFEDQLRGSMLYFIVSEGEFSFTSFVGDESSPLRLFYIALPSVPLTDSRIEWKDTIRGSLVYRNSWFHSFLKSFYHSLFSVEGNYKTDSRGVIEGQIILQGLFTKETLQSSAALDVVKGLASVTVEMGKGTYVCKKVE